MTLDTSDEPVARTPLSPTRIARAAVTLADEEGIGAVTMRGVAHRLEVEAMSLYHHVKNKEALLTIGDDLPRYQQDGGQGRPAPGEEQRKRFLGLF